MFQELLSQMFVGDQLPALAPDPFLAVLTRIGHRLPLAFYG